MHSQGKGISGSALPFRRKPPKWTTITPAAVVELIIKLAKKGNILLLPNSHHQPIYFSTGLSPSQIGVILRDQHAIPQVRFLTGRKILRILKKNGNSS